MPQKNVSTNYNFQIVIYFICVCCNLCAQRYPYIFEKGQFCRYYVARRTVTSGQPIGTFVLLRTVHVHTYIIPYINQQPSLFCSELIHRRDQKSSYHSDYEQKTLPYSPGTGSLHRILMQYPVHPLFHNRMSPPLVHGSRKWSSSPCRRNLRLYLCIPTLA